MVNEAICFTVHLDGGNLYRNAFQKLIKNTHN